MSSYHAGAGGGMGGNNAGLPQGVTQEQLDEIKSFNAGLTQAGNKSRPPRSRGSGLNRGRGSGVSVGRGAGYAGSITAPRSGSIVGYGAGSSYSVGPSTQSPIEKSNLRDRVPIHLRNMPDVKKTRWTHLDSTGAGTLGGHTIGPLNSAASSSTYRNRSPTRSSILVQHPTQAPQVNTTTEQQVGMRTLQRPQAGRAITPPGRQRIVTNMTPDDPSKPFIPAHLHQTSCRVALQQIADLLKMPLSEITSDGISIPASRPKNPAENAANPNGTFAAVPLSVPRQPDVDPSEWFSNVSKSKKPMTEENVAVNTPNIQPMLSESRWASAADDTTPQAAFAANFTPTSAAPAGHARAESSSAMDVEMTGAPSILDTSPKTLSVDPIYEVMAAIPTLADSRWASAQPVDNSNSDTGYGWPDPYASSYSMYGASENAGPALFEAAPTTFSSFSQQENTGSSWEVSVKTFPSAGVSQSEQLRGSYSGPNTPGAPGYVPPHLRNVPPNYGSQVPSWSYENIEPAQPPSQPKQKEKKVKYLKDSMWAC